MLKIYLPNTLELSSSRKNPFFHNIKLNTGRYSAILPLDEFLKIKPVINFEKYKNEKKKQFMGNYYIFNYGVGFVSDDENSYSKKDFFNTFGYSHYTDLQEDLSRINPSYKFRKNAKYNLEHFTYYYEEAIKELSEEELLSYISISNKVLTYNDFTENFYNISNNLYTLPFDKLKTTPGFDDLIDSIDKETISYSISDNNNNVSTLKIEKDKYIFSVFLKSKNIFKTFIFDIKQTDQLIKTMELMFVDLTGRKEENVTLQVTPHIENFDFKLESSAILNSDKHYRYNKEFSEIRKFFKDKFNVKGRSKEDIISKGFPIMVEEKLDFDIPFFSNMSNMNHISSGKVIDSKNKHIVNLLNSEDDFTSYETYLKLSHLSNGSLIDPHQGKELDFSKIESSMTNRFNLFTMPEYGKISNEVSDFDSIIA